MHPDPKKYTAFSNPDDHFHYNAFWTQKCATLQRMIDQTLTGLIGKLLCLPRRHNYFRKYHTKTQLNLAILFQRMRETGLKLQPDKC